jgi:hypothetical protein
VKGVEQSRNVRGRLGREVLVGKRRGYFQVGVTLKEVQLNLVPKLDSHLFEILAAGFL